MKKARIKREQRAEGRKSERSERTNAIREKYGLTVNDDDGDDRLITKEDDDLGMAGW